MNIQSVLAVLNGGSGTEDAVRTAIAIGKAFAAHVEFLRVESPVEPLPAAPEGLAGTTQAFAHLEALNADRTARARSAYEKMCMDEGLQVVPADGGSDQPGATFSFRLVTGHENPEIAYRGRTVDLIVMARHGDDEGGVDAATLEAALFDTGRPVLIAGRGRPPAFAGHLAIAWDGSREAAHSVGLAMPMLDAARTVSVITIGGAAPDIRPLCQYLEWHGIRCQQVIVGRNHRNIADTLNEEMTTRQIDLAVMGAYGHSAIGEYFFGGVTRGMLSSSEIPLFLAH